MNRAIKLLAAFSACLSLPAAALAAENHTGAYVGAAGGKSKIRLSCGDGVVSCSESDTGYKLFGGYRMSSHLSLEGSYIDLGKAKASSERADGEARLRSVTLSAVASLPVAQNAAVFAKLGGFHARSTYTLTSGDFLDREKRSASGIVIGGGLSYAFSENLQARLDYDLMPRASRTVDDRKGSARLISLGLSYLF